MAKEEKVGVTTKFKPFVDIRFLRVRIHGTDTLIVHSWSEKAITEILGKQMKVPKGAKGERDPEMDFEAGKYYDVNGREAFPVTAVKNSMITAVSSVGEMKKTNMRQAFFVWGIEDKERATILLTSGEPAVGTMRADMVRLGGPGNAADIRFRPEYPDWMTDIIIEYNALVVSKDQIVNLLNMAGYGVGIFEWRPEKDGYYGRYFVTEAEEITERPQWVKATSYLRKGEMDIQTILRALRDKKAVSGTEVVNKNKKGKKVVEETEDDLEA